MDRCKSNSNVKLCEEYKLNWKQGPVKILGVTFTTNVYDILGFNSIDVLNKVKSILTNWSKRKLTLFGRVTIQNLYHCFCHYQILQLS